MGGKNEKTILNYVYAINRFLIFSRNKNILNITEDVIVEYIKKNYLNKRCSANTYNLNICAIKYN